MLRFQAFWQRSLFIWLDLRELGYRKGIVISWGKYFHRFSFTRIARILLVMSQKENFQLIHMIILSLNLEPVVPSRYLLVGANEDRLPLVVIHIRDFNFLLIPSELLHLPTIWFEKGRWVMFLRFGELIEIIVAFYIRSHVRLWKHVIPHILFKYDVFLVKFLVVLYVAFVLKVISFISLLKFALMKSLFPFERTVRLPFWFPSLFQSIDQLSFLDLSFVVLNGVLENRTPFGLSLAKLIRSQRHFPLNSSFFFPNLSQSVIFFKFSL